jgi:hypothetical protein
MKWDVVRRAVGAISLRTTGRHLASPEVCGVEQSLIAIRDSNVSFGYGI